MKRKIEWKEERGSNKVSAQNYGWEKKEVDVKKGSR